MGGDVGGYIGNDKTGEIAHGVHQVRLTTVVGNFPRSPEVNMEDVEGATKGPREDEFAVTGNSAVGGETVWALKDPGGNIFTAV